MTPSKVIDAARMAADLLLALVSAPVARQMLNDAEVRRGNAIANAAEEVKFGHLDELPEEDG
jgi:hypothetical protein